MSYYSPKGKKQSNQLFWGIYFQLQSFLILQNLWDEERGRELERLVQIIINSLISLNLLQSSHISYDNKEGRHDNIFFYTTCFLFSTKKSFYFENKLSYSPPKLFYLNKQIFDKKLVRINDMGLTKEIPITVQQIFSYITSHVRMERFTSSNFYGWIPFSFKSPNMTLNLPIYPDIKFINYLKETLYSELTEEFANNELMLVKEELDQTYSLSHWTKDIQKKREEIQKRYSEALENSKKAIFLNYNWDDGLHFTPSHDWRGRKSYTSPIGFTNFKLARLCFHYGENGFIRHSLENWDEYRDLLDPIIDKSQIVEKINAREIVAYLLISMGKFHKIRRTKESVSVRELIKYGLDFLKDTPNLKDHEDLAALLQSKFTLQEFLNGSLVERMICKDATASGYQLQAYLIGVKEPGEGLKYLNLSDEKTFYDTYTVIGKAFLKKVSANISEVLFEYFIRSIYKNYGMLQPYSAGAAECFKNIMHFIKPEHLREMEEILSEFHSFIRKEAWKLFSLKSSLEDYLNDIRCPTIIESKTASFDPSYYMMDAQILDVTENNYRATRTIRRPSAYLDTKATEKGKRPNIIQFHEGDILRILKEEPFNMNILTVHDAFFPSIYDCGKLVRSYGQIFYIKLNLDGKPPRTVLL